jgi:hypothetical protein
MTTFYSLGFETPPTWRARSPYLYLSGTGWPSYTPGTGFPFRRLLLLAGLRWRYSSPPPRGSQRDFCVKVKAKVMLRPSVSLSRNKAPISGLRPDFYYCQTVAGLFMWGALSDEGMGLSLLALPRAVIFGSESRGSRDHILLSEIWDFPFRRLLELARLRCRYSTPPPHGKDFCVVSSRVESYVTTDGQSTSMSWNKAPLWGLGPDFHYCQTVAGFMIWGALFDEGTGLSFTTAAGPRQRSHSRVWVPLDSRLYFTVSDLRLSLSLMLRPTASRPDCLGIKHPSGAYDQIFITVGQLRVCWGGALSLTRGRVCLLYVRLALASVVFLGS